jgi:hypothetical protein
MLEALLARNVKGIADVLIREAKADPSFRPPVFA